MFDTHSLEILEGTIKNLPRVVVERSLKHDIDDLVATVLPPMKFAVVFDVNTERALGEHVAKALKADGILLQGDVKADDARVEDIRAKSRHADALIAVGSGTINDLCKYAAHLDGKPYIVFPTAASMNGYLSANASITFEGYKKTVPAQLPAAVFCDESVIAAAPLRLSQSGLGDSLARPTAQADWLLSHVVLGTEYNEKPFALIAPHEEELFDSARGIATQDAAVISKLMHILLLSGLGMTMAGGSYPASQGEHMIAHAYEMLNEPERPTLHGEEIGVTTLYMAKIQEKLLRNGGKIRANDFDNRKMTELFGNKITKEAKAAFDKKYEAIKHDQIHWDDVRERLSSISISSQKLEDILLAAKAPTKIEQLGWNESDHKIASENARYLRDRFTFLDIQS